VADDSKKLRRLGRAGKGSSPLAGLLRRAHLTPNGAGIVVVAALAWLIARWLGSRTLFLMVYTGLIAVLVSYAVSRRRLALTVVRSQLPARMREGQSSEVTLTLTAARRASTIMVNEVLPEALGSPVRVPIASIGSGEEVEHSYSFTPRLRGVYDIGPATATWSDPFGFTVQEQRLAEPAKVIVHPSVELVHDRVLARMWEDPPIRPPVSKPWPTGFEFYGMREYVRGDDLRRVVWAAVAKTGKMMVRESEQGITDRVSIVLDTDREWHKAGLPSDTFETAVRVVASIGVRHIKDGMVVDLSTNEQPLAGGLRGPRARFTLLDELAKVQMSDAHLSAAGGFLMRSARKGSHFVIVTPHLDRDMSTQLRLLLERGSSIVIVKVVWDESDPQSLARAASLGCQVVQVPMDASIEAAFTHQVGAGMRR